MTGVIPGALGKPYTPCAYAGVRMNDETDLPPRERKGGPMAMQKPQREEINAMHANLCHGLADPHRIALLYELSGGAKNVSDLAAALDMPQSSVSRHLRVLRERQLVSSQRQGTMIFYELADARVIDALELLRGMLRDRLEARGQLADAL